MSARPIPRALGLPVIAWLSMAAAPFGAAAAAAPAPWYDEITVNGLAGIHYGVNFNNPASRTNAFHVFDVDDQAFVVDVAELVVQRAVSKPRESGFRIDLAAGSSIPHLSAAAGLFRDPGTGEAQDFDLQQAFASYIAPVGSGVRFDVGKFVTHCGTEVIEGYDGWNDHATRSFMFGYAIPFTHTGVKAGYAFSPSLSGMVMVTNGWDVATDNNQAKTLGAQLAITRGALAVYLNGLTGAERADSEGDRRNLLDAVASLKATPRVTLGLNVDVGREAFSTPSPGTTATWSGVAGYLRMQATGRFAVALRAERFSDDDGVRTGVDQTLSEVTFTPELRVTPKFILRGDLRRDASNHDVFPDDTGVTDSQTTLLVNALVTF